MNIVFLIGACAFGVLCWTWLAYPCLMWIAARAVPSRRSATPTELPSVTAVLASRDDTATVIDRIDDFFRADYPTAQLEVCVGIDDATPERLERLRHACAGRRVQFAAADPVGGKAGALNAAVRYARGEVLVFSDAQQRFAPDAIRLLVTRLATDPRLGAVGGALQLPGDRAQPVRRSPVEWYWALERELRAAEARVHSSVGVSGSIYAMWRRHWRAMPDHLILDDLWLPMRLVLDGHRIGYELRAMAWDVRRTSATEEKSRKIRTLTGNFQLMAWLPAVLNPSRNPIWFQFMSHKVLRLLTPWLLMFVGLTSAMLMAAASPVIVRQLVFWVAVCVAGTLLVMPQARTRARALAVWGWSMQLAVVEASMNGLRGRWNVWR
jgi:cellulose synthase/poly-beta-1,6-N-acetylglucosamine synthase-like glycosyltransferase